MDIKNFLNARSKELAPVGMMVIVSQGIPNGMLYSELQNGFMFECMSLSFIDMVKEVIKQMSNIQGIVSEAQNQECGNTSITPRGFLAGALQLRTSITLNGSGSTFISVETLEYLLELELLGPIFKSSSSSYPVCFSASSRLNNHATTISIPPTSDNLYYACNVFPTQQGKDPLAPSWLFLCPLPTQHLDWPFPINFVKCF
ncbi:hypothetical protein Peur_018304 [Populus x canadensis]